MKQEKLYFGTAYYPEYLPEDRIDEDFSLMRRAGINVIRIAESTWSTWEPQEGEFCFDLLHRTLRGAQKHGLSVIVGTPTYAIPSWLEKKYPDVMVESHAGRARYGPRQQMDITHPGYRFHAERMIRRLLEQVSGYDCVIGFQLDNETKAYDTCSQRAQAMFQENLQEKFGTVEALNKAFGFAYWSNSLGSWDALPDVRGTINGSYAAEYEAFQRRLVTDFLLWQRSIVDEYRRPEQFVTHNFDFAWEPFHAAGLQPEVDQNRAMAALTVAGCDIYYPTAAALTGGEISFCCDLARGLGGGENFLVMETQAQGPLCNFPYPGQVYLAAFSLLAGGANMVEYWHWHSIHNAVEDYWKGILSHDLTPGKMYGEIAAIGRDLERVGAHLVNLRRESRVALMVSNRSLSGIRNDASFSGFDYNRDALMPFVRSLHRLNVSCDIIWDDCPDLGRYDLLLLPGLYCAGDALIDRLRSYVQGGGSILASCRSFFTDENLTIRRETQPYRMTDVFGLRYEQFCPGVGYEPGVGHFLELLEPAPDTEVLRSYANPVFAASAAATVHTFGRGRAGYIGADFEEGILLSLLEEMLPKLGIPLPENRWPLVVKEGTNGLGKHIRYLLNYSAGPVSYRVERSAPELLSGKEYAPGQTLTLSPWGVGILEY